ncbi:MAG: ATP-dependent 6-phosphofructokinase [Candidatus Cyclonatronum sp.]|uniref:6-phosphofructokinase n=1 Tax=Cyclonatronum sp. TaxID=3024185 RepID=UPI0025C110DD|nr:ATP-dependent 6-phosphofructokinase [Cyclonatronum sp.]MCH8488200.1 ATP-dependent 6-phosphofructokinase [Cyclonatronum sp.]
MKIAINTGGGDAPGLNAVIRSATKAALRRGWEVVGLRNGYASLYTDNPGEPLTHEAVKGITMQGGTILGAANRGNPFEIPVLQPDGSYIYVDKSDQVVSKLAEMGVDAVVAIGGDGSMHLAHRLSEKGLKIVGVPKTIDNDLVGCDTTLGFDTACSIATEAIDRISTTAESHQRAMIVEVMGRYAGWIALHSGLASSADVILIPEIPFTLDSVIKKLDDLKKHGKEHALIVVAEGAKLKDGAHFVKGKQVGQAELLGGAAAWLEKEIMARTGQETRSVILGHQQRGGRPSIYDRLISLRFGAEAIRAIEVGDFNKLVVMKENELRRIPIADVAGKFKTVPLDSDTIMTARDIGICLGD